MNVTSFIFFHDKLFFFSFSSQTDNALFFSTFCEWLMRKTSIFILCKFILEFLILKSMQILIFILIWLDFVLFGRPKSKFLKKEKYIPTELSPLLEKSKCLCIGWKLVKISCPNWMWLDFVVFDSLLNNWWGRRQHYFSVI